MTNPTINLPSPGTMTQSELLQPRLSPVAARIVPRRAREGDELINHLLHSMLQAVQQKQHTYARNLAEVALTVPTNNRWCYHAVAHRYLAQYCAEGGKPNLEHLEQALRLNPLMPDALALAVQHGRDMAEAVVREATGLKDLEVEKFLALTWSGNWTEFNFYRESDDYFRGKTVLDFGARTGFHGLPMLAMGVRRYAAMDLVQKAFKQTIIKNYFDSRHEKFDIGFNMEQMGERYPERLKLTRVTGEGYQDPNKYDFITMIAVSEHLSKADKVFEGLGQWLAPEGRVLISHHNFYCWNGHHNTPKSTEQYEEMKRKKQDLSFVDWMFFKRKITNTYLNRLRVGKIRSKMEKYFEVVRFEPEYTKYGKGVERISTAILRKVNRPAHDLLIQNVRIELAHKPSLFNRLRRKWDVLTAK